MNCRCHLNSQEPEKAGFYSIVVVGYHSKIKTNL